MEPEDRLILRGDSVRIQNVATAWDTENTFLVQNAQGYVEKREVSLPALKYVATDESNNTTTAANITNLSVAVSSGEVWSFSANLIYTTNDAAGTTGARAGVSCPGNIGAWSGIFATSAVAAAADAANGSALQGPTTGMNSGEIGSITLSGTYYPNASGTLQLTFASETASTITIKAGSSCTFTKIQ